jgi:hypothetical protein
MNRVDLARLVTFQIFALTVDARAFFPPYQSRIGICSQDRRIDSLDEHLRHRNPNTLCSCAMEKGSSATLRVNQPCAPIGSVVGLVVHR